MHCIERQASIWHTIIYIRHKIFQIRLIPTIHYIETFINCIYVTVEKCVFVYKCYAFMRKIINEYLYNII